MKPESQNVNFVVTHRQPSDCGFDSLSFLQEKRKASRGCVFLRKRRHERIFEELADERGREIHGKDLLRQPGACQPAPHVDSALTT